MIFMLSLSLQAISAKLAELKAKIETWDVQSGHANSIVIVVTGTAHFAGECCV